MNITAKDKSNGNTKNMAIEKSARNLNEAEIERLAAEAEKYKAEDEAVKARLDARNGWSLSHTTSRTVSMTKIFKTKLRSQTKTSCLVLLRRPSHGLITTSRLKKMSMMRSKRSCRTCLRPS